MKSSHAGCVYLGIDRFAKDYFTSTVDGGGQAQRGAVR